MTRVGTIATEMAENPFENEDPESREELQKVEAITLEQSQSLGISFAAMDSWNAFYDYFDREWFERVWCVQEILPAREAMVLCGSHAVEWELVKGAATWFLSKAAAVKEELVPRKINGIEHTLKMNIHWQSRWGTEFFRDRTKHKDRPEYTWSAFRLLNAFRSRLATDPRDKAYALLGVSDLARPFNGQKIDIDYSKSTKEVYTDFARGLTTLDSIAYSDLDILLSARPPSKEVGWPSWVPDWRENDLTDIGTPWDDFGYRVTGTHTSEETEDIYTLKVRGVILGKTTYVTPFSHAGELLNNGLMRQSQNVCLDMVKSYPTGESVETAHALALLGGTIPSYIKLSTEEYVDMYLDYVDAVDMPNTNYDEQTARNNALRPFNELGFTTTWMLHFINTFCERRMYVTDSDYIGIGYHRMEMGDVIAVLEGLSLPAVLRPLGEDAADGYAFIGYVEF